MPRSRCFRFIAFYSVRIYGSWPSIWNESGELWRGVPASKNEPDPQRVDYRLEIAINCRFPVLTTLSELNSLLRIMRWILLVGRIGLQARLDQIDLPTLIVFSGKNPKREKIALEAKQLKSPDPCL
jgi:hypothetical protein